MSPTTKKSIETLWEEVRELSLGHQIDHLKSPPTALQFLRDHVSPNKPCLISNSLTHCPALSLWPSTAYLRETLSSDTVFVHLTPTGRADATAPHPSVDPVFASAHVEKIPFPAALEMVTTRDTRAVAYHQEQNDCFRNEYGGLSRDCDDQVPWASDALGFRNEAVNIWIGDERSVTSFHKDHCENLYVVICGEKLFLLLPPTDFHRMYIRDYPVEQYRYSKR